MKINHLNVHGGQVNIADHIGKIEFTPAFTKDRFTEFTEVLHLSDTQTKEVQQIYKDADAQGLDESKVTATLLKLEQHLMEIQSQLPAAVVKQLEEVKKLQTGMGIEGKFKTSIPIIPFIMDYEIEGKINFKDLFKQIWQDMKNGEIFLKKKA